MRKLILLFATGLLSVSLFAQSAIQTKTHDKAALMQKFKTATAVPFHPVAKDDATTGVPNNNETFYAKSGLRTGETVGTTGYDLQTNSASMDRVRAYDDGTISVLWTGSTVADHVWSDRGMFYNFYDGTAWGAAPTTRVEIARSGFGGIYTVMDHEIVVSHDGTVINIYANSGIGNTDWTSLPISSQHLGLWPRAYVPVGTDDIYLVSPNTATPTAINFSRSDDGGATYTVLNSTLPLDAGTCFGALSADCYQIAVDGNTVYILYGSSWTNLVLLTSTSNGDPGTWTSQTIIETGLCNYQGDVGQISDVNADGIGDTIETTDGFHEMVLDDAGVLHIWSGYYWLLDNDIVDATGGGWSYFPSLSGLWYWNSTMAAGAPMYMDGLLLDWDEDGDPFLGIGADLGMYDGVTFTSMPNVSIDETTGRIYLMYTHPIEYTDYFDDPTVAEAQSFRDIFGTYSDDGGLSWSAPVNMTYTAHEQYESVLPYCYDRVVGDCVHTIWMEDREPGTSLDSNAPDADGMNNMKYRCFDEERFNPYPPTAEFDYTPDAGLVSFANLSVDADQYSWDFGDTGNSTLKNPSHVYAADGNYNVCLIAMNKYDEDNTCKVIEITGVSAVINYALDQAISVYPTPATTNVTVNVEGNFGTMFAEMYNALGEKVINTSSFTGSVNFDVTTLASGNYIVKVYTQDGAFTSRQITVGK